MIVRWLSVDEEVAIVGRYPTNQEIADFLNISVDSFDEDPTANK